MREISFALLIILAIVILFNTIDTLLIEYVIVLGVFSNHAKTIFFFRKMAVVFLLNTQYIYEYIETFLSVVWICEFDHCRETG